MSDSYTKLFASITKSTIWSEPMATRIVWITMLAGCNRSGEYYASVPGLARDANVSLAECEAALATMLAPDYYSRTPDNEGRRIEPIDRGWKILNHAKFDRMRSEIEADERLREQKRQWDREHRPSGYAREQSEKVRKSPNQSEPSPAKSDTPPTADVTAEDQKIVPHSAKSRAARLPQDWQPTVSEMRWAADARPDVDARAEVEKFRDYWHAKAGRDACKRDWSATWRNWIRNSHGSPRARGSPQSAPSKMASAMAALEEMKHGKTGRGMVPRCDPDGIAETRSIESG